MYLVFAAVLFSRQGGNIIKTITKTFFKSKDSEKNVRCVCVIAVFMFYLHIIVYVDVL